MTKFRKRALLSSVAMLIVALIALGTATFAWYEANNDVWSTGMNFSTNAASGLEIVSASAAGATTAGGKTPAATSEQLGAATYGQSTTFAASNTNLQPASADKSGNMFHTTGTSASLGTIKDGATVSANSGYYLEEIVYFKTTENGTDATGKVQLTGVTITHDTTTGTSMDSAVRVVIFDQYGNRVAEYADAADNTADYLKKAGTYTTASASEFIGSDKVVLAAAATGLTLDVSNVSTSRSTANFCKVRVYLDGFDSAVKSDNAIAIHTATNILDSLRLDFTYVAGSTYTNPAA